MKLFTIGIISLFCTCLFGSCIKPDPAKPNDKNQLSDIWIAVPGKGVAETRFNGVMNPSQDTIYFNLPPEFPFGSGKGIDLAQVMVRANIPVDARVSPSLASPQDLSKPLRVQLVAGNGSSWSVVLAARTNGINPDVDFRFNALNGRSTKIDPAFPYYKNRTAESIADEVALAGYKAVHYIVVNELDVRSDLVDAFHQRGIAVWLLVFANGTYSAWGFPAGWENWKMQVLNPGNVAPGFTYFSPFSSQYVAWKKGVLASLVSTIPFDGVELFEPFFPDFTWNGIENGIYGDIGPNAQQAFLQKHGSAIPNFTNPADPNYYKTNTSLYNTWVQFRVDGLKDMHTEIFNGANGIRAARPDILVGAWGVGIDWGGGVSLLREFQGLDGASLVTALNPDIYFLETHWPDWIKTDLAPTYINAYQPFFDQVRNAKPNLPMGIQTDYGSHRNMIRPVTWMQQYDSVAAQRGYSTSMGYEFHIGGNIYFEKPKPVKAVRQSNGSVIISFNKRIDATSGGDANHYTFKQNGVTQVVTLTNVTVDGNRVILQAGNFPTGTFEIAVSYITDTPALWLFTDFPANEVVGGSTVSVP
jgi:hypothetical protein